MHILSPTTLMHTRGHSLFPTRMSPDTLNGDRHSSSYTVELLTLFFLENVLDFWQSLWFPYAEWKPTHELLYLLINVLRDSSLSGMDE